MKKCILISVVCISFVGFSYTAHSAPSLDKFIEKQEKKASKNQTKKEKKNEEKFQFHGSEF